MPLPIRHGLDKSGPAPPRGMVLVYVMIGMVAFLGLASLAVDAGHARLVKARLQHIADASALYSASGISDGSAIARALAAGSDNQVDGKPFSVQSGDVTLGNWSSRVFTAGGTPTNAVRVIAVCSSARGNAVPLSFGQIIGFRTCDVQATAIAKIGSSPYGIVGLNSVSMSGGSADSY